MMLNVALYVVCVGRRLHENRCPPYGCSSLNISYRKASGGQVYTYETFDLTQVYNPLSASSKFENM
jgi:hypothetical protein